MVERIVVMFAYHFPPENAIGGFRPYYFYKYLSRMGYRCHVITAAGQGALADPHVEYIPDPFLTCPRDGIGWQLERVVRKLLIPAVTGLRWSRSASRAARTFLASKPGTEITIYSTYPPLGTHFAALLLIRKKKLKWIADCRDPLGDNPSHIGLTKFQQGLYRWLERLILKKADIVVANTDAVAEQLKNTYPGYAARVHLIWNGFDPEDPIEERPLAKKAHRVYSHIGELYGGRNITPLLNSVSRLVDTGQLMAGGIRIRLIGPFNSDSVPDPGFLRRATEQGWLQLGPGQVPQQEARRIAQDSDGLLLVQPQSRVQVPGKLFEYLRLGRPILAFILPGTPIERILSQSGVPYQCVYAESSPQEMEKALLDFFALQSDACQANTWFKKMFDAQEQTAALENLIRSIHSP
ncbi:MAG: glycosyltransferase [Candidatus Acidiferrum sp.]|jgi:glycosyltransferase involved in cell wall biosynthesis